MRSNKNLIRRNETVSGHHACAAISIFFIRNEAARGHHACAAIITLLEEMKLPGANAHAQHIRRHETARGNHACEAISTGTSLEDFKKPATITHAQQSVPH
jgi:hypothetical protein